MKAGGWAHLKRLTASSFERVERTLEALGLRQLGHAKLLRPIKVNDAKAGSMSAHVGFGVQPLHTDCANWPVPPRYLTLRCLSEGAEPVVTTVYSVDWNALLQSRPKLLFDHVWLFQMPEFAGTYASIIQPTAKGKLRLRLDPIVMRSPKHESMEAISLLRDFGTRYDITLAPDELLILDNWSCLHSRGAVLDTFSTRAVIRKYWS